MLVIFR